MSPTEPTSLNIRSRSTDVNLSFTILYMAVDPKVHFDVNVLTNKQVSEETSQKISPNVIM